MAEELPILELPANGTNEDGVEEITDTLDEIAFDDDALTGTHLRTELIDSAKTGAYVPQAGTPARTSAPPPVPPEARQSRPPASRSSVVPPPPRVPSHSGMFRIERPSAPSLPPPAALSANKPVSAPPPAAEQSELKEVRAHLQRLRLMVRLREDRIRELEAELRAQRERTQALESELSGAKTQRGPDDLKRIAGIGPSFERGLHAAGVTSFEQIAAWTPEDIENIALKLRIVTKRIVRDRWIESARQLVADEEALSGQS